MIERICPAISVVVCTRDRPQLLQRCLDTLSQVEYDAYEAIVVDSASSTEATAQVVAATPFRYVRQEQPGLDVARNRGASEAKHGIIAYIDDDTQVDRGWLQGLAQAFADPQVAVVTGLVLPAELDTPAQYLFEQYSGMGKGEWARQFQRETMRPHDLIAVHAVGVGANMAFRRSVFEIVGGFDPALDVGTPADGAGDLDMFHRALLAGLTLRYEPKAVVWHQHRRDMAALERQLYANGRSFGVYLLKVWAANQVRRRDTLGFAARWVGGWLLARLYRCFFGQLRFPLRLVWAELWGALHAPWAYWLTYREQRRVRPIETDPRYRWG